MTKNAPVSRAGRKLQLRIRVVGIEGDALGPGKAQLLEQVQETGSLNKAAARLEMSYMKAWRLAEAMNENFLEPLLEKTRGGSARGGTCLTPTGRKVLAIYHRMCAKAEEAAQVDWKTFLSLMKS